MAETSRPRSDTTLDAVAFEPPCGIDDPRIHTFGLLLEAHSRLTRALDADLQASDGITLQTFEVLLRIARADGGRISMSDLADGVAITTGGVTRLADRLQKDGLVQRVSCPSDRRVVYLALTDAGHRTLGVALQHHLDSLDRHVAGRIAADDLPAVHRTLDTLRTPLD
jgi:MarR family transcriptional regulator, 2-MHQ and catechol-resistance regulon repressor